MAGRISAVKKKERAESVRVGVGVMDRIRAVAEREGRTIRAQLERLLEAVLPAD